MLIIQSEKKPVRKPNDSAKGGCFVFNFTQPVALINFGLLDTERVVNITVRPVTRSEWYFLVSVSNLLLLLCLALICRLRPAIMYPLLSQVHPVSATMDTGKPMKPCLLMPWMM